MLVDTVPRSSACSKCSARVSNKITLRRESKARSRTTVCQRIRVFPVLSRGISAITSCQVRRAIWGSAAVKYARAIWRLRAPCPSA